MNRLQEEIVFDSIHDANGIYFAFGIVEDLLVIPWTVTPILPQISIPFHGSNKIVFVAQQ